MLERAIGLTRGGRQYRLDPDLGAGAAAMIMVQKSACAIRGAISKPRFAACELPLFIGRRVIIRNADQLSLGKGVVIDDYTVIEALSREGVSIGAGTTIEKRVLIRITGVISNFGVGLVIGRDCSIGAFSFLGAAGGITIGDNVLVGQRVSLHAENHIFSDRNQLIRDQGVKRQGIRIEDDCWIGSGTVVLDGVCIGKGSVIGAGSVLVEDIPPFSVAVGSPARVIKERGAE